MLLITNGETSEIIEIADRDMTLICAALQHSRDIHWGIGMDCTDDIGVRMNDVRTKLVNMGVSE